MCGTIALFSAGMPIGMLRALGAQVKLTFRQTV